MRPYTEFVNLIIICSALFLGLISIFFFVVSRIGCVEFNGRKTLTRTRCAPSLIENISNSCFGRFFVSRFQFLCMRSRERQTFSQQPHSLRTYFGTGVTIWRQASRMLPCSGASFRDKVLISSKAAGWPPRSCAAFCVKSSARGNIGNILIFRVRHASVMELFLVCAPPHIFIVI